MHGAACTTQPMLFLQALLAVKPVAVEEQEAEVPTHPEEKIMLSFERGMVSRGTPKTFMARN